MSEERIGGRQKDFKIELLVVFAILVSLGFPGNFTEIYGNTVGTVLEYSTFFIEILAMLLSSGDSWLDIRLINLDKRYIGMYAFWAVVFIESMLVTRYPSEEAVSCIRLLVTMYFAIWLQERFRFQRMVELIGIAQAIFLMFNLIFMVLYPRYAYESGVGFTHALRGLYPTKNNFATELSFGIVTVAYIIKEKRNSFEGFKAWMAVLIVHIALIFMCQATGPIFCTVLSLAVLFLPEYIRLPLGWGYIAGNIGFLFGTLSLMPYFEWFFEAIGKDATLTGRIPLWRGVIDLMTNRNTFTGYGYAMFWRDPKAYTLLQSKFPKYSSLASNVSGAHNVLMDFWLNIGLIGIAAFFVMAAYSCRKISEISKEKYYFSAAILMFLLTNGFTERCLGGTYEYKMLLVFLVLAVCSNRTESEKR